MAELQYNTDHVHAPDIHNSYIIYKVKEGESETDFPFQFPYLKDHPETIHVFVDGIEVSFSLIPESSQVKVVLDTAATEDQEVMVQRRSISDERLVNFVKRNDLKTAIMDLDSDQIFFLGQEAIDIAGLGLVYDMTTKTIDANGFRIINLGDSEDPEDAMNSKKLMEFYQAVDTFINTTVPNSIEEVDEHKDVAKDWAIKTDGKVKEDEIDIDYSSKYYADLSRQEKEASESFKDESKDWAIKMDGKVKEDEVDVDYSAKYFANKALNEASKAQDWAVKEDDPVEGTSYSSRHYSLTSFNNASLAKDWAEKMDGKINDEGYSAKYWAEQAASYIPPEDGRESEAIPLSLAKRDSAGTFKISKATHEENPTRKKEFDAAFNASGFGVLNDSAFFDDQNLNLDYDLSLNGVSISTFGSLSGDYKWSGGVLAPNGKIYGIPFISSTVLEIDPSTRTASTFGSLSSDPSKWTGGVLAPNGKIYGIPRDSTEVLEIDPSTRTVSTFGSLSSDPSKWTGGVLAPNGKIYGIPRNSTEVLEIDPSTRTVSTFGSLSSDTGKWTGGVLAPNGKIYGIPLHSTTVLEIDPSTRTVSTFGSLSGNDKWKGGVLAPNGKIYGIPRNSTEVLEIDPSTRTASTFGSLSSDSDKWFGGVLAPNGKIYGIPFISSTVLEIDPSTRTASTFGSLSGDYKWFGGVLAPNGKIYGIPLESTTVLEIDPHAGLVTPETAMSPYYNKF